MNNIFLIVIDCLRRDHLGCYGYEKKDVTPFIDRLATSGLKYENCYSASNWTYPAVGTLLTGMYPVHHGAKTKGKVINIDKDRPGSLREDIITLPQYMARAGYSTLFYSQISWASRYSDRFEVSKDYGPSNQLERMIDDLIRGIEGKQKVFAYLHVGELHTPLAVKPAYRNLTGPVEELPGIELWAYQNYRGLDSKGFAAYCRSRINLYDNALRYVNDQLNRLHFLLKKKGRLEDSLIIITADHGEEFWDRVDFAREHFFDPRDIYGVGHGHSFYNELINVPLIIYDGRQSGIVEQNVSHVDIMPTLLKNCLSLKDITLLDGMDLSSKISGRAIYSESPGYGYDKAAIIFGKYKLIYSPADSVSLLYDLDEDYAEKNPCPYRGLSRSMQAKIDSYIFHQEDVTGEIKLDEETVSRLQDLGYMN